MFIKHKTASLRDRVHVAVEPLNVGPIQGLSVTRVQKVKLAISLFTNVEDFEPRTASVIGCGGGWSFRHVAMVVSWRTDYANSPERLHAHGSLVVNGLIRWSMSSRVEVLRLRLTYGIQSKSERVSRFYSNGLGTSTIRTDIATEVGRGQIYAR